MLQSLICTRAHVCTVSNYKPLALQPLGDGAAECTTIKIQKGHFYHSPHLGFSTIKLSLRLKFIPGRKRKVLIPAVWTSQGWGKAQIFLQHNSLGISYHGFFHPPGKYLNSSLPLDKPVLFQEVKCPFVGLKASAYLYMLC